MADLVTGSCNCGRHKFTIPRPAEMNLCHCLDCCKWAGAFHSAHLLLKTEDIRNEGPEPKKWSVKADSGNTMERAFCEQCGAGIWIRKIDGKEETTNLKAGLFDRKDICNPTMENWMKASVLHAALVHGAKMAMKKRTNPTVLTNNHRIWSLGRRLQRERRDKLLTAIEC